MPLSLRRGRVTAIVESVPGLVRCEVDGVATVAYPELTGEVEVGDEVLVNVQARELGLGSGGFDVLYANLTRGLDLAPDEGAHVMVHPYAPGQFAARFVEEDRGADGSLDGLPVVCCTLHSQVAPACAGLAGTRVAYVQVAGGALPVSLSDTLRVLRQRELVAITVAVAPCFGADAQAITAAGALEWIAGSGFDAVVCSLGPGIVGTGSPLGHGALALADAANAASALSGVPIVPARVSERDERDRHRGISHHTRSVERFAPEARVVSEGDDGWREACDGLPLSFMGRGPDNEPEFFAVAFAAGRLAASLASTRR